MLNKSGLLLNEYGTTQSVNNFLPSEGVSGQNLTMILEGKKIMLVQNR